MFNVDFGLFLEILACWPSYIIAVIRSQISKI